MGRDSHALTRLRRRLESAPHGIDHPGQMRFWLEFYDVVLNVKQTHEHDGRPYFMPINAYNTPNAASSDTGGGMSTNIYAGGIFDLKEDEALYIEATFTGEPVYTSIHLGNLWGESPDYATAQSSLNHHQMYMGEDGAAMGRRPPRSGGDELDRHDRTRLRLPVPSLGVLGAAGQGRLADDHVRVVPVSEAAAAVPGGPAPSEPRGASRGDPNPGASRPEAIQGILRAARGT